MKVKTLLNSCIALAALVTMPAAHAGNGGVYFYYGASLGALMIDEATGYAGVDPAPTGAVFAGLEEDGWALEYLGLQTAETGTDVSNTDYKVTGSVVSLGYRTIEKNGQYYKLIFGKADTDVDLIVNNATTSGTMDGNVYTLGWGMRLRAGDRVEVDYSYYDPSSEDANLQFVSKVHMISLRYMFGGAPSAER